MTLSTIIITKNCAKTIEYCLESVRPISTEIIILDSGSHDKTIEICKRFTNQVFSTDWPGFGAQKQRALDKAKENWVLSIDADEVLTKDCQTHITKVIKTNKADAYRINRLMVFAGQLIYHSGCSDQPIRLFKKKLARFSEDIVHEHIIINAKTDMIDSPMLHYSYQSIGEWIKKMNLYSELGAQRKAKNKNYTVKKAVVAAMISFIKMYFLKGGFLDGRLGFVAAINAAVASYYKYLKLALDKYFTLPNHG